MKIEKLISEYCNLFGLGRAEEKEIHKKYNQFSAAQKKESEELMTNFVQGAKDEGRKEQNLALQGKKIY